MRHTFVPRNCLVLSLVLALSHFAPAENKELTADETIPIPKVEFDAQGELKITASPSSSANDFDFLVGKWKMHNRHLDKRLANCRDWTEFDSSDVNTKILRGAADMDTYSTTQFPGMGGKLFEGLTLRLFDPKTRLWSLYWIASNTGKIDPPVVGSFDQNGVGHFFGKDTFNGKPILVVFRWDARNKERPVWGQAFSPDNRKTWEWNFFNVSERPKEYLPRRGERVQSSLLTQARDWCVHSSRSLKDSGQHVRWAHRQDSYVPSRDGAASRNSSALS